MVPTKEDFSANERVKEFIESIGSSYLNFAREIGMGNSARSVYKVVNNEQKPTPKFIKRVIERYPDLSYDWIVHGRGRMLKENTNNGDSNYVFAAHDHFDKEVTNVQNTIKMLHTELVSTKAHFSQMFNVFFTKMDQLTESNNSLKSSNIRLHDDIIEMAIRLKDLENKANDISDDIKKNGN